MFRFNFRLHPRLGPFIGNISRGGWTSTTFRWKRFKHNFRSGRNTFDTPGPGSVSWGGDKPARRRRSRSRW